MDKDFNGENDKRTLLLKLAFILLIISLALYIAAPKNQSSSLDSAEEGSASEQVAATEPPAAADLETATLNEYPEEQIEEPQYAPYDGTPLLAIVVDDGGHQMKLTDRVAALDIPLTWAIIPYRQYSSYAAQVAAEKSVPFIIHLPMQAHPDKDHETDKFIVGRGMNAETIRLKTAKALDSLPGAIGLNNHRGSTATEIPELVTPVLDVLKSRGLLFLDSRTTSRSVAYDEGLKAGVPSLQNRGFIDNSSDKKKIEKSFEDLLGNAQKRGALVVICHFRPATVDFLEKLNARYKKLPVRFVTLPEMLAITDNGVVKKIDN